MRLLFFGTYDAAAHPRAAILRDGLAGHGATVQECNVPLGLSTAARVSMLRRPWTLPRLVLRLVRCWATLVQRSARYRRGESSPDAVVVGYLGHFDVLLARRLFPHVPVVLDHLIGASDTAADRGVGTGLRHRLLRRLDEAALGSADVVVVDTDEHLAALPDRHRRRALVVPVGAPASWYADGSTYSGGTGNPGGTDGTDRPLRAVFFGLFTPLQGAPVIGTALGSLVDDDVDVTMVGSGQDHEETRALAVRNRRVTWVDWVPPDRLPELVARHDVCLGIFGTGPKALRVVPNKVFQGAAAGCALVTSDTAPQRRVLGEAAVLVPPGDAGALATALRDLAADRDRLRAARSAASGLARSSFTPAAVTAPLFTRLQAVVPRRLPT
jgi:glycosyltransferase involved in cell wall biosynthesis